MEVNPCSPSISCRKRAFFQPNAIGEIGATKRELERMAAPATPTRTGGFGPEFAKHPLVRNSYAVTTQEAEKEFLRRACAEIRDVLRDTAVQPGKAGAVSDPELESSTASGQGNVTTIRQLKEFLHHYFARRQPGVR